MVLVLNPIFFHCFSGADATCSFYRHSKVALYKAWIEYEHHETLTSAFIKLGNRPTRDQLEASSHVVNQFLCYVYSPKAKNDSLNSLRFELFQYSIANSFRELPPTEESSVLHIARCSYQAGWVWGNSLAQALTPPLGEWGWKILDGVLYIRWTQETSPEVTLELLISVCSCRTAKCKNCSCRKKKLACMMFCLCRLKCTL